jgi:PleD family two-component response regulator
MLTFRVRQRAIPPTGTRFQKNELTARNGTMTNDVSGSGGKPRPRKGTVPRLLVVDDEESILSFAELHDAGYEVIVASSGAEVLRIVEAQRPFDLFVIDVGMPQMSGDEFARRLRHMNPDAKVLYFHWLH